MKMGVCYDKYNRLILHAGWQRVCFIALLISLHIKKTQAFQASASEQLVAALSINSFYDNIDGEIVNRYNPMGTLGRRINTMLASNISKLSSTPKATYWWSENSAVSPFSFHLQQAQRDVSAVQKKKKQQEKEIEAIESFEAQDARKAKKIEANGSREANAEGTSTNEGDKKEEEELDEENEGNLDDDTVDEGVDRKDRDAEGEKSKNDEDLLKKDGKTSKSVRSASDEEENKATKDTKTNEEAGGEGVDMVDQKKYKQEATGRTDAYKSKPFEGKEHKAVVRTHSPKISQRGILDSKENIAKARHQKEHDKSKPLNREKPPKNSKTSKDDQSKQLGQQKVERTNTSGGASANPERRMKSRFHDEQQDSRSLAPSAEGSNGVTGGLQDKEAEKSSSVEAKAYEDLVGAEEMRIDANEAIAKELVRKLKKQRKLLREAVQLKQIEAAHFTLYQTYTRLLQSGYESFRNKLLNILEAIRSMGNVSSKINNLLHHSEMFNRVKQEEIPQATTSLDGSEAQRLKEGTKSFSREKLECPEACHPLSCKNKETNLTQCFRYDETLPGGGGKLCKPYIEDTAVCPKGYMPCAMAAPVRNLDYSLLSLKGSVTPLLQLLPIKGQNLHRCMQLLVAELSWDCTQENLKETLEESARLLHSQSLVFPKIIDEMAIFEGVHFEKEGRYKLCLMQFRFDDSDKENGTVQVLGVDEIGTLNIVPSPQPS